MADRPYSRVYWTVMDDEKFDGIRENVRHFGSWTMLLIIADMAYPAAAFVPASIPKSSLTALAQCGLVDLLSGGRYRVHGLASERGQRSDSARNAAAKRWHSNGNADPMLDETRRDKTRRAGGSQANASEFDPPRPKLSTVDRDPILSAYRDAIRETNGNGMDDDPSLVTATKAGWKVKVRPVRPDEYDSQEYDVIDKARDV